MAEEVQEAQGLTEVPEGERFALAGAAILEETGMVDDEVVEAEAVEPEVSDEKKPEASDDEGESSEGDKESDGKDDDEQPPGWRFKRLRNKEKEVSEALESAKAARDEAEGIKLSLEKLTSQIAENPVEAVFALAERAGIDGDALIEHIARGRVARGIESPEMQEIRRLKAELAKKDELKTKEAEAKKAEAIANAKESYINHCVENARAITSNEELSSRFKYLAALGEDQIVGRVRYAANWAAENNPSVKLQELIETLDGIAKEELETAASKLGYSRVDTQTTPKSAAGTVKQRSISNRDHGSSGAPVKSTIDMTPQERQALAARVL